MSQRRDWCFTVIEPEDVSSFAVPYGEGKEVIKYAVFQLERSPKTGSEHIQGYVEFYSNHRINAIKSLFHSPSMHLEARKGTREQARDYCMKDSTRLDGPWEFGEFTPNQQGRRNDIHNAVALIKDKGMEAVLEEYPTVYVKYHRGLEAYALREREREAPQFRTVQTVVIYGASGVGKTYAAVEYGLTLRGGYHKLSCATKTSTIWWDGYTGQELLIVDDFTGGMPWDYFAQMLDPYLWRPQIKGGHTLGTYTKVIITSNLDPENWFRDLSPRQQEGFERRTLNRFLVEERQDIPVLTKVFEALSQPDVIDLTDQ